jgi:hypothetical protein
MISLTKANSFAFLSEVTLDKKVFVRSQINNEDSK